MSAPGCERARGVPEITLGFSSSYWKLGGLCEVVVYHRHSKKESRTPLSLRIQQCFLEISVLQQNIIMFLPEIVILSLGLF